jgi:pimeloyl-ACP methyl ester carboxylesterase
MISARVTTEAVSAQIEPGSFAGLRQRLATVRLPAADSDGWERGSPGDWLRDLLADWHGFDLGAFQARLDSLHQLKVSVDGQDIHVIHEPGRGPDPLPLILTNGWPSSFCEYLDIVPHLTDPGGHGADPADAFTVVIPSLPGFGFSAPPPPGGLTGPRVAALWHRLMTDGLGCSRYVAHGSDLGAGVAAHLGRTEPESVGGVHLATPSLPGPPKPWSPAEASYFGEIEAWSAEEGGYAHVHATKPSTLGAALYDSPAGLAAWIGEKVIGWSSTRSNGEPAFERSSLLATLTLYWVTGTIASSLLPYWAYRHTPGSALPLAEPGAAPTAVTLFGGERVPFPKPPRELAERYFSLSGWAEYDRGGHFPATAEPRLLAEILRDTFRPLRQTPPAP